MERKKMFKLSIYSLFASSLCPKDLSFENYFSSRFNCNFSLDIIHLRPLVTLKFLYPTLVINYSYDKGKVDHSSVLSSKMPLCSLYHATNDIYFTCFSFVFIDIKITKFPIVPYNFSSKSRWYTLFKQLHARNCWIVLRKKL